MTFAEALDERARQYLTDCVLEARGNMAQAARIADLHRSQFYRLCSRYDIRRPLPARSHLPALSAWASV